MMKMASKPKGQKDAMLTVCSIVSRMTFNYCRIVIDVYMLLICSHADEYVCCRKVGSFGKQGPPNVRTLVHSHDEIVL